MSQRAGSSLVNSICKLNFIGHSAKFESDWKLREACRFRIMFATVLNFVSNEISIRKLLHKFSVLRYSCVYTTHVKVIDVPCEPGLREIELHLW